MGCVREVVRSLGYVPESSRYVTCFDKQTSLGLEKESCFLMKIESEVRGSWRGGVWVASKILRTSMSDRQPPASKLCTVVAFIIA
jgi:hypothetical protein